MFDHTFQGLPCQVQTIEGRISLLKAGQHPNSLLIVIKTTKLGHATVQRVLTGMAKGRMTKIMGKRDRLGKIVIQAKRTCH